MTAKKRLRVPVWNREVSATRRRELKRLSRKKKQLTELFLAADDVEPRVFDDDAREALAVVLSVIVDECFAFKRLATLKSESARWSEWIWATTMISANMDSIQKVKWTIEGRIADCKVNRSQPLPSSIAELEREHRELFELIGRPGGDDNERARRLIRILQLELIWFGQMW